MRKPLLVLVVSVAAASASGCALRQGAAPLVEAGDEVAVRDPKDAPESGDPADRAALRSLRETALDMAWAAAFVAAAKTIVGWTPGPLLRLGAPELPIGGAQPAILNYQPRTAMPAPAFRQQLAPPRATRARPAICHSQPVPLKRK